jgi:hypothetical protein
LLDLFTKDKELRKILEDAAIFGMSDDDFVKPLESQLDAYPTDEFGVQIDPDLIHNYKEWQE